MSRLAGQEFGKPDCGRQTPVPITPDS